MKNQFPNPIMPGADPFIVPYEGKYYLYCTPENDRPLVKSNAFDTNVGEEDGITVYESNDLIHWENKGYCLKKGDVVGEKWFWAPEVTYYKGKFYMLYVAEEHIAVATADHPLGPFTQKNKVFLREGKALDGHIFIDDDGRIYLYYVRLGGGNRIFAARLSADLMTIEEEYEDCLICAEEPWETVDCKVAEGCFMVKHKGIYYLSYSCNHTRNPAYAVGYATATSPLGPFRKYEGNPILSQNEAFCGLGHHSFTKLPGEEDLLCIYHCHNDNPENFKPRMVCINTAGFRPGPDGTDILVIHGPNPTRSKKKD